ncbi:hypothetical protein BDZ97DRAFT_1917909 [Flammula alnicola]|nr:hypothetical protein BDZ97DRAFT_1917909 [Flammula alnicola]
MDHFEDITLVDLKPEVVKEIFRVCSFDSLRVVQLVRCEGLDGDFLAGIDDRLQFVSLDDLSSSFDLCAVVRNWRCTSLSLSNCDCVDDAFIDFLTQSEEVAPPKDEGSAPADVPVIGGRRFACTDLKILVLAFRSNLSIPMLKRMVEARSHYVDYSDPNWKMNTTYGPALMALIVKRSPSEPPVSEEDQKWFSERVPQILDSLGILVCRCCLSG